MKTLIFAILLFAKGMDGGLVPPLPPYRIIRTLRTIPVNPSDQLSVENPVVNQVSGLITFDQWMVNMSI